MPDDGIATGRIDRHHRVRIRKSVEVLLFIVSGLWLWQHGPFWRLPVIAHGVVCVVITIGLFVIYQILVHTAKEQFLARKSATDATTPQQARTYQVPKRFGMLTIVFATAGIALVAAAFQALRIPKGASLMMLGFVAMVAIMQAIMDRVPRSASVIGGMVYAAVVVLLFALSEGARADQIVVALLGAIIFGALYGYIAGAFIAGLFMGADAVTKWWQDTGGLQDATTLRQSPWDDEPPETPAAAVGQIEPAKPRANSDFS